MKTPILFSIDKNDQPTPVFSQGDYDVFVGALEADKLPQYVIMNRTTNVVEFTTEVTPIYKDWLNHFVPVEKDLSAADLNQLSLGLKN